MEVRVRPLDLTLTTSLRNAQGVQSVSANVVVEIEHEGITGLGEAAPNWYYGEHREIVLAALPALGERLGDDPLLIEDIIGELDGPLFQGHTDAKAALDMALYDLMGKRLGVPVYRLLGLNPARAPQTSYTIAIDSPDEMARKARAATEAGYSILKIKVGTRLDIEIVQAIRAATDATLRVDANGAWTTKEAIQTINALAPYAIEFVEQPVAARDLDGLRLVRERVPLAIIADESCLTLEDIPLLASCVDGINIKLMKCGGIHTALNMIHTARAHHLKVMLGCNIESSLAITAAAMLSPLVDYADLDSPLLIQHDPFVGVTFAGSQLVLPAGPGLGVSSRTEQDH